MTIPNNNLLKNPIITDLSGWTGYESGSGSTAPSVALSDDSIFTGKSIEVTAGADSPVFGVLYSGNSSKVEVTEGSNYTFSAYVKVPNNQVKSTFALRAYFYPYYSSSSGVTSLQTEPTTVTSGDGWVRLVLSFTVPTGETNPYKYFGAYVYNTAETSLPAVGYKFLVDGLKLEVGTNATEIGYEQDDKNRLTDRALQPVFIDHLKGMKLKADVRIDDFVFNRIDEYGVIWVVTDIQGWHNLPEVEMQDLPRGWGDGSFVSYGRYAARQITIAGTFLMQNPDTQMEAARQRLLDAVNLVKREGWLVLNEDVPKGVKVRLNGVPEVSVINARGRTDFSIGLVAADPIKYKWADTRDDGYAIEVMDANDGVVTITNDGNTPVSAIFEIAGPTTGVASIFNKTNEQLIDVVGKLDEYKTFTITGASVSDNIATFTTSTTHGFEVGKVVDILNVVDIFHAKGVASRTGNTIDVTTSVKHSLTEGQNIYITGLSELTDFSAVTNGIYTITAVYPTTDDYKFTFVANGTVVAGKSGNALSTTTRFSVFSNTTSAYYTASTYTATVNTASSHGLKLGDQVVMENLNSIFNGTYVVTGIPSVTAFEYEMYGSQTIKEVSYYSSTLGVGSIHISTSPSISALKGDYIEINGIGEDFNGVFELTSNASSTTINSVSYTTLNFAKKFPSVTSTTATSTGYVRLAKLVDRSSASFSSGRVYLGNIFNGQYEISRVDVSTPEVFKVNKSLSYNISNTAISTYDDNSTPQVLVYGDYLSIDTYNREVALNGEVSGYRSMLDTIVDWIVLEPGENEIEFTDKNKVYSASVSYTTTGNVATISTRTAHYLVPNASVTLVGLQSYGNAFANATVTVATVPNTKSFTYVYEGTDTASNVSVTTTTSGYIYRVSPATLSVYYRSGWIG